MARPGTIPLAEAARYLVPKRRTIAGFGDSITANNSDIVSFNTRAKKTQGFVNWAAILTRQKVHFDPSLNFGVPG